MYLYPLHLTDYEVNDTHTSKYTHDEQLRIIFYTLAIYILPITVGNLSLIFIFSQVKLLQTPSNCTIVMLAVADLLMGVVVIPITLVKQFDTNIFHVSSFRCFLDGPLRIMLFNFNGSMILLLTLERYIAVVHPFWYTSHMSMQKLILGAVCLGCIDIANMSVHQSQVDFTTKTNNFIFCDADNIPDWFAIFEASIFSIKLAISLVSTLKVVTLAIRSIKAERKRNIGFTNKDNISNLKSDAKVTSALMFLFVILLSPTPIIALVARDDRHDYSGIAFHFAFLNSCLNVVVYAFTKGVYKAAFIFLLTNRPCNWTNVSNAVRSYYASQSLRRDTITSSRGVLALLVTDTAMPKGSSEDSEKSTTKTDKSVDSTNTVAQPDASDTQNKTTRDSCCTSLILSSPVVPPETEWSIKDIPGKSPSVPSWLGVEVPKQINRYSWLRLDDQVTTSSQFSSILSSSDGTTTTTTTDTSSIQSSDISSIQSSSTRSNSKRKIKN